MLLEERSEGEGQKEWKRSEVSVQEQEWLELGAAIMGRPRWSQQARFVKPSVQIRPLHDQIVESFIIRNDDDDKKA